MKWKEVETSLYFFKSKWTLLQKMQMCIDKFGTIHALLVKRDTVGFSQCTFEWMVGCICLCGMEAVTRLLPAGNLRSAWDGEEFAL